MRRIVCAIVLGLLGGCAKTSGRSGATDGGEGRADGARAEALPTGDADGATGVGATGGLSPCDAAKVNRSASGCEFYSVAPAAEFSRRGYCFAGLLTNTWTSPVTIQVSYFGMPLTSPDWREQPKEPDRASHTNRWSAINFRRGRSPFCFCRSENPATLVKSSSPARPAWSRGSTWA